MSENQARKVARCIWLHDTPERVNLIAEVPAGLRNGGRTSDDEIFLCDCAIGSTLEELDASAGRG